MYKSITEVKILLVDIHSVKISEGNKKFSALKPIIIPFHEVFDSRDTSLPSNRESKAVAHSKLSAQQLKYLSLFEATVLHSQLQKKHVPFVWQIISTKVIPY